MLIVDKKVNEISIKKLESVFIRVEIEVGNIISQIEDKIVDKEENYEGMVYDVISKEGYEMCCEVCKELCLLCVDIEKM